MTNRKKKFFVRRLVCTYLILMLLVSGCADRYGRVLKPTNERVEISRTHTEFSDLANSENLPIKYISEGKIGVSQVEAALESADTADVQARAKFSKQSADFSASRTELEAQINQNLSEAEALRKRYSKEYSKAMAQITARETGLDALIGLKDANVASLIKEGDSKRYDIIATAREKFDSEQARIEQLKAIRNAIEIESSAMILEMTEAAKATRERATATVIDL
ncbi:MAG: hypothetical protein ACYS17_12705, partial [Planctomycetota bacterium]